MRRATDNRYLYCFTVCLSFFFLLKISLLFAQPGFPPNLTPRQEAEFLLLQKRYEESIRLYTQILEKEGGDSPDFRGLVKAYAAVNRLADAEEFLKRYIATHPESSSALYAYGYIRYLQEQDVPAGEYLAKALDIDPENTLALNNLGAVLARRKLFPEAIDKVKKAIAIKPTELLFYQNLKSIYEAMGESDRFIAEYREYRESGQNSIVEGYGKTIATALRQEGFKLYSQQKTGEAIDAFIRMLQVYREIKHAPGEVAALFSLGLLYEETGDIKNAEKYYREVLAINPNHIQAKEKIKGFR